jgi:DNA (cytosine-5)-methyltransferase 1
MASNKNKKVIKVTELFAGVGGFRVGLDRASKRKSTVFKTIWSNQWEPSTKKQHASEIYIKKFSAEGHSNVDIAKVPIDDIPNHDLLVGGFPCQDYSVARNLGQAAGLEGKKGVLWWQIHRILKEKETKAPNYLMLENVDRLVKSPVSQRGRDFAVMLASLADLNYAVEWRIINAADYGMPQRRRRIYILGYKKGTSEYAKIKAATKNPDAYVFSDGLTAQAFPIEQEAYARNHFEIEGTLDIVTKAFNKGAKSGTSPFHDSGLMFDRKVWTWKTKPNYKGDRTTLGDILIPEEEVPKQYFLDKESLSLWKKHKGGKNEVRSTKSGHTYNYSEGPMVFPDPTDKPSRTIVTGEGGPTPSRFKHVVKTDSGKLRRLTPIELERLNMFDDDHTVGTTDARRAFFMGNALVVGVIEKIGEKLLDNF